MYTEQIAKDLDEKQGIMILLNGKWGTGKTYRWKYFIANELTRKKALYFSLFGLTSVEDLRKEIFNNYISDRVTHSNKHCVSKLFIFVLIPIVIIYLTLKIMLSFRDTIYKIQEIENSKAISYIKHFAELYTLDNIFWIVMIIFIFIIVLFMQHCQTLTTYFLNKFMGINYNNVCIDKLYSSQKVVFCFDDFERIANIALTDEFLGYFNLLSKTYKFNILIIANSQAEYIQSDISENVPNKINSLVKYQEKLFDRIYIHEEFDNFQNFLESLETNETLRECLKNIYLKLKFAGENLYTFKKEDRKFITTAANNLRLLKKIKDNMDIIYNNISYETLDKEETHTGVINFVAAMTLGFETGRYTDIKSYCDDGTNTLYQASSNTKKEFIDILFSDCYFHNYQSTYDLIYRGKISENLKRELLPLQHANKYTKFEEYMLKLRKKHLLAYRSMELKDLLKETDNLIKNEDILFSSYNSMYTALGTYCILLDYNGQHITTTRKTGRNIKRAISCFIKQQNIFDDKFNSPSWGWNANKEVQNDYNDLYNYIFSVKIKNMASELIKSKNLLNDYINIYYNDRSYILRTVALIILYKKSNLDLNELYKKDFEKFQDFVQKVLIFDCESSMYNKICKALGYTPVIYKNLIDKIVEIAKYHAANKAKYTSEYRNYENLLERVKQIKQQNLYRQ